MTRRHRHLPLLLIVILTVAIRWLYFSEIHHSDLLRVPILDARTSLAWAADLAGGDWGQGRPYWMAPLYPHLLAVPVALFGASPLAPVVLQLFLGVINLFMLHRLATRLSDGRVAMVAVVLWALYAPAVFYAGFLVVATLLTTLMLGTATAATEARDAPTRRRLVVLGLWIGVASLARGNVALLAPASALLWWGSVGATTVARRTGWVVLGLAVCLAPVALRNVVVGGDTVLLTSNAGMNLAIGQDRSGGGVFVPLHSDPSGHYDPTGRLRLEEELGRSLKPSEVSRIYADRALDTVLNDPVGSLRHTLRKAWFLIGGYELPQLAAFEVRREASKALRLMPVPYWILTFAGLAGFAVLGGTARRVLLLVVVIYLLSLLPFFPTARYRQPVSPLLAFSAAALLVQGVRAWSEHRFREGRWRTLLLTTGLTAAVTWPGWTALDADQVRWQSRIHDARRAELAGRPGDAARHLDEAALLLPALPDTWYHIGQFHRRLGNDAAAMTAFRAGEQLAPDDRLFPYHLGRLLLRADRVDEASASYLRCIELDDTWAKPVFGLGMAGRAAGDLSAADSLFQRAVVMAPGNPRYRNNLALVQAERGNPAAAERQLVELLADFPGYGRGWINLGLLRMSLGRRDGVAEVVKQLDGVEGLTDGEVRNRDRLVRYLSTGE